MKVLIADDHPVVRKGVKQIISDDLNRVEFAEATCAEEVFVNIDEQKWDILILDINLPDMNGLEVLKRLRQTQPKLPVLILTVLDENQIAVRVLKAGASGFMTKNTMPDELVKAVTSIRNGGRYVSSSLAETLVFNSYAEDDKPPHYKLSNREYQVLCLIAIGKSIREISRSLDLSEQTVRTYRMRILEKMNLHNDAEMVHYAINHELIYLNSV